MQRIEHHFDFTFLSLLFFIIRNLQIVNENICQQFFHNVIIIFEVDFGFFQFRKIVISFLMPLPLSDFLSKHIDLWL